MRKLILSLLVAFATLFPTVSKASHMMGADMSYKCLGNGKYKITAKIYRDCRGISFNSPSFLAYGGVNGGNGCGSYNMSISRTGIRDVTPRCSTASKPCNPQNTYGTGEGIEEHTYEVTVDFTKSPLSNFVGKSSCCEVSFAIGQCCRNGAITTGPSGNDFWTTCMINICNIKKTTNKCNSSPQLSNEPIGFLCCNQAYYFNNGAIDTVDFDSFSYKLVPGLRSLPSGSVNYSSPFDYKYFMTPYCIPPTTIKCTPNPKTKPPRGMYFDTGTGDLIFTPTKCDEVGICAIEITEWRKDSATGSYLVIGKTRRDMQLIVKDDCGYNKAPTITGPVSNKVCEGEQICFTIKGEDETFSPYQTVPDTVQMKWNKGIPGATFTIKNPTAREKEAEFCWTPAVGMASDVAYSFTVTATDDHCPKPSQAIRGFKVRVNPRAFSERYYTVLKCGKFAFHAKGADGFKGIPTFKWSVRDSLGQTEIYYSTKQYDTMTFYQGGKYIFVHTVNNSDNCPTIYRDTVEIPDPPKVILAAVDTFACYGTNMEIYPVVKNAKPTYGYYWSRVPVLSKNTDTLTGITSLTPNWTAINHISGDTGTTLTVPNITRDSIIHLKMTDGDGCIFFDTLNIYLKPLPLLDIGPDQRICTYESVVLDAGHNDTVKYLWSTMDTTQKIEINVAGKYRVTVTETKWLCQRSDTMELFVNDTVVANAGPDVTICHLKSTLLAAQHEPVNRSADYTWYDLTGGKTLGYDMGYTVSPKNSNTPGQPAQNFYYRLYTTVTQGGHTCEDDDTVMVKVNTLPFVKWDPKPLKAQCYDYGDIELNNFFNRGKETGVRMWAGSLWKPNNMIDSILPDRHLFKTTLLDNNLLQNGNNLQMKVYGWYKDTNGCINIDSVVQRINGNPVVVLDTLSYCQDLGEALMDNSMVRPKVKVGVKLDWSVLDYPNGVDPSYILNNNNPWGTPDWRFTFGDPTEDYYQGTYKFQLCVEDQLTGCRTCDSTLIDIVAEPTVKVKSPDPVCVNWGLMELYDYITVNGNQAKDGDGSTYEIIEYNYDRNDPKVKNTNLIGGHQFLPSFGTGTWYIRYSNAGTGCLKQDSFYIYVNDTPDAVMQPPITVCSSLGDLDLKTRVDAANTKPASAIGVWTGPNVNSATSMFTPVTNKTANIEGPRILTYVLTDNNGCTDTETYNVFVRTQPEVQITTQKPAQACERTPFAIQSSSLFSDGKVTWTRLNGSDGSIDNASAENISYQHGLQDSANKGAYLKVTTVPIANDVCPPASDSIEIILHQYPIITPLAMQTGCVPLVTNWMAEENKGIPASQLQYSWTFGNGDTSSLQNPSITYKQQGKYDVVLTMTNTAGPCSATTSLRPAVEAYPIPVAKFVTDPPYSTTVALPKFKITNMSTVTQSPFAPTMRYNWDFGTGNANDTSTMKDPRFAYGKDTATYTIRLITTTNHGCSDTAERKVVVGPDIIVFIPDVFTPDGAGPQRNNTFNAVASNFKAYNMRIYNRWGEKLFETDDINIGWDGTANGAECQQDVYVYHIEVISFDDKPYKFDGTVTLLR
jgi:gliding motility-associated-like protein